MTLVTKAVAVYPVARTPARPHAVFTTLLMSTRLTFGGTDGIVTQAQFSALVTVVVLSADIPTAIAPRFVSPRPATTHDNPVSAAQPRPARENTRRPGRRPT